MALFQPKYKDKVTGKLVKSNVWWFEFTFAGKRIRQSAKTTRKTVAAEAERNCRIELEKTLAGMPIEKKEARINTVRDVVATYLSHYPINHREGSVTFSTKRLKHVKALLGATLLPNLTEDVIRDYIKTRLAQKASGRTINMELGELSRAIGFTWSVLWPKVRKLEERKDVGKALSTEDERKLLDALNAQDSPNRSRMLGTFIRTALLTGMRAGEIVSLKWGQIDFSKRVLTVGRAKTSSGTGRQIPLNNELFAVLSMHADWFTERFGETKPEYFLFPFGTPQPVDPTRHITDMSSGWKALRKAAGVNCRLNDLRHTAATKMAEAGIPESTMLALMGHMSRAMLERYSHIRMAAKREAMEALSTTPKQSDSNGLPKESPKVEPLQKIHFA